MFLYPLLTFLWAAFIFVATCTSNAYAFLYDHEIQFTFKFVPNLMDLLITSDIHLTNEFYLIQKTGHMVTFGVLYFFHYLWMKKLGTAFALTGIFAIFSEVLQLYFNRNGRLFDVGIDFVGIFVAYLLCKAFVANLISARHSHS